MDVLGGENNVQYVQFTYRKSWSSVRKKTLTYQHLVTLTYSTYRKLNINLKRVFIHLTNTIYCLRKKGIRTVRDSVKAMWQ